MLRSTALDITRGVIVRIVHLPAQEASHSKPLYGGQPSTLAMKWSSGRVYAVLGKVTESSNVSLLERPTMASLKLTKEPPRVRNGDQVQLLVGNCTSTCCANSDGNRGDREDCDISVKTAVFMESGSVVDRCYL
jgi:hypothetical protein